VDPVVDPDLVRPDDPEEIIGDASLLRSKTGWIARIPLRTTLSHLLNSLESNSNAGIVSR
jgi:GDP-D-mannose dehydratase